MEFKIELPQDIININKVFNHILTIYLKTFTFNVFLL